MSKIWTRTLVALALLLSVSVVGCDDDKTGETESADAEKTEKEMDEKAEKPEAPPEDEGPTVAEKRDELVDEYAVEAETSITADNAEDAAAELEAEINADLEKMEGAESGE